VGKYDDGGRAGGAGGSGGVEDLHDLGRALRALLALVDQRLPATGPAAFGLEIELFEALRAFGRRFVRRRPRTLTPSGPRGGRPPISVDVADVQRRLDAGSTLAQVASEDRVSVATLRSRLRGATKPAGGCYRPICGEAHPCLRPGSDDERGGRGAREREERPLRSVAAGSPGAGVTPATTPAAAGTSGCPGPAAPDKGSRVSPK